MGMVKLTYVAVIALATARALAVEPIVVGIWEGEKKPYDRVTGPERIQNADSPNGWWCPFVTDVSDPQMFVYRAPAKGVRPCVVVCPGGGYNALSIDLEGYEIAHWLNRFGYAAAVLKYRVPGNREGALADAQRAFKLIRMHADEWRIDPKHVGVIGFSAGANLAAKVSTAKAEPECRPDFTMLIYCWDLVELDSEGKKPTLTLQKGYPVDSTTPPAFIVHTQNDPGAPVENALGYFAALRRAGVLSELHVFPVGGRGGHGYGIRTTYGGEQTEWPRLALDWLTRECSRR